MNEDELAEDYLRRLSIAADRLPPGHRDAVVADVAARIAEARRTGPQRGTAMASVHLHNFLDQLGDPADVVRPSRSRHRAGGRGGAAEAGGQRPPAGRREVTAVALLLGGGFLAGVGWLAGVLLLWTSPRWRVTDKVLGTLIWPGGLAGVLVAPIVLLLRQINTGPACLPAPGQVAQAGQACPIGGAGLGLPGWLFVVLLLVLPLLAMGGSAWMSARLLRRARAAGADTPASDSLAVGSGV